jgi:hypothetical protein
MKRGHFMYRVLQISALYRPGSTTELPSCQYRSTETNKRVQILERNKLEKLPLQLTGSLGCTNIYMV